MANKMIIYSKKLLSIILTLILLFNINAQLFAYDFGLQEEVVSDVRTTLENIVNESSNNNYDLCLRQKDDNACKAYLKEIKESLIKSADSSQESEKTLESKLSYEEFSSKYQETLKEEYKKALEEIEKNYREGILFNNLTWEEMNHLNYLKKKQTEQVETWKKTEENKTRSRYKTYENDYNKWQAETEKEQQAAGKKYLRQISQNIINATKASKNKSVHQDAIEILAVILEGESKPGELIADREALEQIFISTLEKDACAYTKDGAKLNKSGADKYIGYDKPGINPTLTQDDWQIIEAKYKDEKACNSAFIALEGLSRLKASKDSIGKVLKFMKENQTGLVAGDSLLNGAAVLLKWKAYENLKRYIQSQMLAEKSNNDTGFGGFGSLSQTAAYNGRYLGEVSIYSQREDGTNAWEDLAALLAEEASPQSKEILKSALSSCKIVSPAIGRTRLECKTILPFLYGAILNAPEVMDKAKPYQEPIPQTTEYLNPAGHLEKVDVARIERQNGAIIGKFREELSKYGQTISSGLAGFFYNIRFSDMSVDSKMLLDNKLAKVYKNLKSYKKGSARYEDLKKGRAAVAIFRYIGIAVDVWFTLSLFGLAAKGVAGTTALIRAKSILQGAQALSVAQRANILRRVAFIKEGSQLRRFGRNFAKGMISSGDIGRKINASAYLAERNGMGKINYMLHNIAYGRGKNIALRNNILMVEGSKNYFQSSYYLPRVHNDIFRITRDIKRASKIGVRELGEGGQVVSYIDKAKIKIFKDYTDDFIKGQKGVFDGGKQVNSRVDNTKVLPLNKETNLLPRKYLYDRKYKNILPFAQDKGFSRIFNLSEKVYKTLIEEGKYVINTKTGEIFKDLKFHFDGYLNKNNILGNLIIPVKQTSRTQNANFASRVGNFTQEADFVQGLNLLSSSKNLVPVYKNTSSALTVGKPFIPDISNVFKSLYLLNAGNLFNIKMPAQISAGQMDKMAYMQGRVPAFNDAEKNLSNIQNIQSEALGVYNYNNDLGITYIPGEPLSLITYNGNSPKKMAAVEIANKIISDLLMFSSNISTREQTLVYNRLLKEIYTLNQPSIDDPMLKINKIWEEASWYMAQKPLVVFLGDGTTPIRPNHIKDDAFFSYPLDKQKDYKAFIADKVKRLSSVLDEYTIYVQIHGERNNILKLDKERNVSLSEILDIIEENKGNAVVNVVSASCHGASALGPALNRKKINVLLLSGLNDVCVIGDINFVSVNDLRSSYIEAIKNKHYGATLIYEGKVFNSLSDGAASELACPYLKEEINNLHSIYFKDDLIGKDLFNLFVKFPKYKAEFYPFDKIKSLTTIPPVFNPLGNLKDFATLIFPPTQTKNAWLYSLTKLDSKGNEISSEDLFFEEVGNETSSFLFDNSLEKLKQTFPKWEYKPVYDYDGQSHMYNSPVNSNPQQNLLDKPLSAVKNNSSESLSTGAVKKLNIYKEQTKLDTQKLALINKINKNIDNLNTLDITKLSAKKQAVYKDIKQKIETLLSKNTKPNITELKRLETLTALLNIEKPFLVLQGAKSNFKIPFNFSDIRILDLSKEKNYQQTIAREIKAYASVFDNFPVYLSTHGFVEGNLFISKLKGPKIVNSNLLEIANIIKENKLDSKVDLISGACHSGAGFTPELLNTDLNILLFTGANDVCVNTTNMGFIEYNNLPNTYLNAVSEGYYGATLIYEGKIYNPLELGLKAAKNNETLTKELDALKKIYLDADITGANLGKDVYNLLNNFKNYESNLFIGEKFFYFPKMPFIFNPVITPEFMAKSLIKRTNDDRWVYFLRIFDEKEKLVYQKGTSFAEPKEKTLNFLFKTSKKALAPVFKKQKELTAQENINKNIIFLQNNPEYLQKYKVVNTPKKIEDLDNLNITLSKDNVVYRGVSATPELLKKFLTEGFNISYVNNNGSSIDVPYDNKIYFASKIGTKVVSAYGGDISKYKLGGAQEAAFYSFSNLYNEYIKKIWKKQGFDYKTSPEQQYSLLLELKFDPKYIDKPSWSNHFYPTASKDVPASLITKAWLLLDEKTAVALHKPLNIEAESQIAPRKKAELISYSKKKENVSYKEAAFKKNFNFLETEKSFLGIPVFKIQTIRGSTHNIGTGFYLKYRNFPFILTAAHVVEGNTLPYVTLFNDNGFSAKTKILSISEKSDLAVLSVPKDKLDFAEPWTLALKEPQIGDKLVSVGFPGSNSKKISEVSLLKTKEELNNNIFYLHDRDNLSYGASGSPLSADKYSSKIYGVVAAADTEENVAASVPLPQIRTFLGQTIKKILFTPELNSKFLPMYPAFAKNYENVLSKYTKFKKYPKQEAANLQNSQDRVMPLISKEVSTITKKDDTFDKNNWNKFIYLLKEGTENFDSEHILNYYLGIRGIMESAFDLIGIEDTAKAIRLNQPRYLSVFKDLYKNFEKENLILLKEKTAPLPFEEKLKTLNMLSASVNKVKKILDTQGKKELIEKISTPQVFKEEINKLIFAQLEFNYTKELGKIFDFASSNYINEILKAPYDFYINLSLLYDVVSKNITKSVKQIFDELPENKAFAKMCKERGINYEAWRGYNLNSFITRDVPINGGKEPLKRVPITVRKVDMDNIPKALTTGNESSSCRSVYKGLCGEFAPNLIRNKMIQQVEVIAEGRPVGNALLYLAEVDGKTSIVIGSFIKRGPYSSYEVLELVLDYVRQLRLEISTKEMPVYLSNVVDFDNHYKYPLEKYEVMLIGDGNNEIFNSLNHNSIIPSEHKKEKIELFNVEKKKNVIDFFLNQKNLSEKEAAKLAARCFEGENDIFNPAVFEAQKRLLLEYIDPQYINYVLEDLSPGGVFMPELLDKSLELSRIYKDSIPSTSTLIKYTVGNGIFNPEIYGKIKILYEIKPSFNKETFLKNCIFDGSFREDLFNKGLSLEKEYDTFVPQILSAFTNEKGVFMEEYFEAFSSLIQQTKHLFSSQYNTVKKTFVFIEPLKKAFDLLGIEDASKAVLSNRNRYLNIFKDLFNVIDKENAALLKQKIAPLSYQNKLEVITLLAGSVNKKADVLDKEGISNLIKTIPDQKLFKEQINRLVFKQFGFNYTPELAKIFDFASNKYIALIMLGNEEFNAGFTSLFKAFEKNINKPVKQIFDELPENKAFAEICAKNGINYQAWRGYDPNSFITRKVLVNADYSDSGYLQKIALLYSKYDITDILAKKIVESRVREVLTVRKVDMDNISKALTTGNESSACRAVGRGVCREAAPDLIKNKMVQQVELLHGDKVVGNVLIYLAEVDGKLAIVMGSIIRKSHYYVSDDVNDLVVDYVRQIRKDLGREDIPIYMSTYLKVSNHYPTDWRNVKLIVAGDKKIFNSFTHAFEVPSEHKTNTVLLYEVDEGIKGQSDFVNASFKENKNFLGKESFLSKNFNFFNKLKNYLKAPVFKLKVFENNIISSGTGFYIKYRNFPFILTAGHVVRNSIFPYIKVYDNIGFKFRADILNISDKSDLAVLSAPEGALDSFEPYNLTLKEPLINDKMISLGYPRGAKERISKVSLLNNREEIPEKLGGSFYMHEKDNIDEGVSGGPLSKLDSPQEILGVVAAINKRYPKVISVPLPQIRTFLGETVRKILFTPDLSSKFLPMYPAFAKNYENVLNKYIYTGENAEKPLNLKTDIVKANYVEGKYRVLELRDAQNNIRAYYKLTRKNENDRTKLFDKIITKRNLQSKYPLINIEYPKILSTDVSDLPDGIIPEDIKGYFKDPYFKSAIITPVDASGWSYHDRADEALTALNGKQITNEEWAQVIGLFKDLNKADFYHNDLENNLFFKRDNNGKLILTIIDFEYFDNTKDMKDLNIISMQLESIGAKEKNSLKNTNNQYLFNLPSWVLPAVGVGLLAFSLANPASAAFALAAVPLMSHNIKLTAAPKQKGISAKTLFTKKYKNNLFTKDYEKVIFFHRDIGRVMPYLPSDFIENKAIYRGMTLEKYEDLKRIFVKGLEVSKSSHDYIFFSREVNVAIDYSTQYNWGHLPVIIKKHNYSKLDHNYNDFGHIVRYSRNIPYKNIDDVLVWAQLDGKLGWWRASLDENGEVILQPTDNMQTVK